MATETKRATSRSGRDISKIVFSQSALFQFDGETALSRLVDVGREFLEGVALCGTAGRTPAPAYEPARYEAGSVTGIPPGQTHFRNDYPVDERLVSRVPAPCGVPKAALGACAFPLAWRFFGVGSEALRVGLPGGFAVTLRPAAVSGCGYQSRSARQATPPE